MVLNSTIRDEVLSQNYLLFKKFIKEFTLNKRFEKTDMIVNHNVIDLIKTNIQLSLKSKAEHIQPFVFFTDGGVCSDEFFYSMHQLFGNGKYLYSSKYLNEKELLKGVIL